MVAPFPLAKLAILAVKQMSKPLANYIKRRAKAHRVFRDYICIPTAQLYNKADVRNRLSALGMGKPKDVQSLTDEMAVELGAEVLGELTLMVILTGGIAFEYYRSASKSDQKQEEEEERMLVLERQIQDLTSSVKRQELHIREITESVSHNESYISKLWNIGSKK